MPKINYVAGLTSSHEKLVIRHLQEQWLAAEKAEKRHEVILKAKAAGVFAGKSLLALGLMAGVLTIAAVAPNAFSAFGRVGKSPHRYFKTDRLAHTLRQGSSKKYWTYLKTDENTYRITLTLRGRQIALRYALKDFRLHTRPEWDGTWWIIMFDIAKKYSNARDGLRRKLYEIGMYPLQESVYVFPYPCQEEVMMWVELFGLQWEVVIMTATFHTDHEATLLDVFHLTKES